MDSRQAREILALYRPGSADAADPRMAEALDQVKLDPELAAWFQEHCAVYTAIRAKLKAVPVPPGLKREIIVGRADHARIIPLPGPAKILLAAAAVVLLTTLVWFTFNTPPSENTFARFRDRMARSVQRSNVPYMKMYSTNQTDVLAYFTANQRPTDFALSKALQQLPAEGGSAFTWNNHPVEMLCLNAGTDASGQRNDLWVFVMDKKVVPDAPGASPQFFQVGNLMTASWTVGDKTYVLAARGNTEDLKKYLD
ncbi:MAG TPA: hypothetical protein VN048_18115 [Verrucomicrobiae bacterium]|nr:hypothetical protein [Verrucomicrobiae bacterium]